MDVNLLSYLQGQFTPAVVAALGEALNEPTAPVQQAVEAIIPIVLTGLVRRAQEPNGAADLIDVIQDGNYTNTPLDVREVLHSRGEAQAAAASGSRLLDPVFGDQLDAVAEWIATYSSVRQSAALSIMDLVGSVLMGVLSQASAGNESANEALRTLLSGQANEIQASLPAGIGGFWPQP